MLTEATEAIKATSKLGTTVGPAVTMALIFSMANLATDWLQSSRLDTVIVEEQHIVQEVQALAGKVDGMEQAIRSQSQFENERFNEWRSEVREQHTELVAALDRLFSAQRASCFATANGDPVAHEFCTMIGRDP